MTAFTAANAQLYANRAAPACRCRSRACAGVGSSANRYARTTTAALTAAHRRWRPRPPSRPDATADRRPYKRAHKLVEHLGDVADQIVGGLARLQHHDAAPARGQRRGQMLEPEPGEPVTTLHDDDRNERVGQKLRELPRCPFIPDPTSLTHLAYSQTTAGRPATTRPAWRSRSSFWSAQQTRQHADHHARHGRLRVRVHQARRPTRRAGTGNLPSRNQPYAAVLGCTPCSSPTPSNSPT